MIFSQLNVQNYIKRNLYRTHICIHTRVGSKIMLIPINIRFL